MSATPLIFNISRTALHDGNGIRTVVFFKGCSMRCQWCHNPEGQEAGREILLNKNKCITCGSCSALCNNIFADISIDRAHCTRCGGCAEVCPTGAISVVGQKMSVDEIMKVILKDKEYFDVSGGGVTLSGGECLLFPEFAETLLKECKANNLDTLIETALNVPWGNIERVLPYVDTFFADLKHMDDKIHKEYTGVGNPLILENLKKLSTYTKNIIIRVPSIPGVNDGEDNMKATERFANDLGLQVEVLKYNDLAKSKYDFLGKTFIHFGS